MDTVMLQTLLALAMFFTTTFAGLLPVKVLHVISRKQNAEGKRASWCLTLLSCFAGGVFLGTCFLDIFPHVNANYAKFRKKAGWVSAYPLPELFICFGFFLVYFLEEICLKLFSTLGHGHSHNHSHHHAHAHGNESCNYNENSLEKPCSEEPLKISPFCAHPNYNDSCNKDDNNAFQETSKEQDNADAMNNFSHKYSGAMTHEIVIEDSVRYLTSLTESGILKSITFAIAMSFHSVLEGFALGVQENSSGILTLFFSLIIHKGIESFSVGLQITKPNSKRLWMVTMTIIIYALMTPLGSIMGVIVTRINIDDLARDGIIILLEGMAGGTFIYVTFFEVLAQERANEHSNLIQLNAIVVGFLIIAGMQVTEHLGFGHSHGH